MSENLELEKEFQQAVKQLKKEKRRYTTEKIVSYSILMLVCSAIFSYSIMAVFALGGVLFCTLAIIAPIELWPDSLNLEDETTEE